MVAKEGSLGRNLVLVVGSNGISLAVSLVSVLLLPKLMGVGDFAFFQLYLFYSGFVGLFQFGLNDGLYLRLGGVPFSSLNNRQLNGQFRLLLISQVLIAAVLFGFFMPQEYDGHRQLVVLGIVLAVVILGVRAMPLLVLQATNRLREYSVAVNVGSLSFVLLVAAAFLAGHADVYVVLSCDLASKCFSLLYLLYVCRSFVIQTHGRLRKVWPQFLEDCRAGLSLTVANLTSLVVVGALRFGIERSWGVVAFGSISLVLNVTNLMILFVGASGVALFPAIRKLATERLVPVYLEIRDLIVVVCALILLFYVPIRFVMGSWLPDYAESFAYLGILYPIFLFDARNQVLTLTFMKAQRLEKGILVINGIAAALSCLLALLFTWVFPSLTLAVVSILVIVALRSLIGEAVLAGHLGVEIRLDQLVELCLVVGFVVPAWFASVPVMVMAHIMVVGGFMAVRGPRVFGVVQSRLSSARRIRS